MVAALLSGSVACTGSTIDPARNHVVILVSGTSTEPRPGLTDMMRSELADAARSDVDEVTGSVATVVSVDGTAHGSLPLSPRRPDGSIEHGLQRDSLIEGNLQAIAHAVAATTSSSSGVDLLDGIAHAVRGLDGGVLVVVSNGLSTAGGLDLRDLGWDAEPTAVAQELFERRLLQSLTGFRVIFIGLGATAGDQPRLPKPARDRLIAYWRAICAQSGALTCTIDETVVAPEPAISTVRQPIVDVPGIRSIRGPDDVTTTSITDDVLGFAGDRWELSPAGVETVHGIAEQIRARPHRATNLVVTVTGYTADPPSYPSEQLVRLAQARANTVAVELRKSGVPSVRSIGAGPAPGMTARVNGSFDESAGAQMRRVEITY